MSSTTASQETPKKVDLGLLEEDDEFEEFPAEGKFQNQMFLILSLGYELFEEKSPAVP